MVNLKEWMMILELHEQGLSVSAIAERTGHDRKTVRKVIGRGLVVSKYAARTPRPTLLGRYETHVRERVAAWPELSGVRLLREVRERGYAGGITQLNANSPSSPAYKTASGSSPWCSATVATCGAGMCCTRISAWFCAVTCRPSNTSAARRTRSFRTA